MSSTFIFLRPSDALINKHHGTTAYNRASSYYSLLIKDYDDNLFIFKQKNDDFFDSQSLRSILLSVAASDNRKMFEIREETIPGNVYKQIKGWKNLSRKNHERFIEGQKDKESVEVLDRT